MITVFLSSVLGAGISSILSCVPGLHVYNVLGLLVLGVHMSGQHSFVASPEVLVPFAAGMIVAYAMLNTIPSVLLAAPDESALFTVLPGQKYLMNGRGFDGTITTAVGGLAALLLLVGVVGPLAPLFLPVVWTVFKPHAHWILWCVICFMLMSEWPKVHRFGLSGWRLLLAAWRSILMGLMTFLLSGTLGFLLYYRSPIAAEASFQNLMPGFVGLFTMPWLVLNIVSRAEIPAQHLSLPRKLIGKTLLHGTVAGTLGGGFAAFFPAVTGGVGGFLAGHATALRNDRVFLVSQGASKVIYYVAGFLLFFVPGLHITRGGGAWLVRGLYVPTSASDYYMVLAAIAFAGAVSFLAIIPLAKATILLIERTGYRRISGIAAAVIVTLVLVMTGWKGLCVTAVAAGIGLIPMLFGSRRMNCLGVILLPMACNMSGIGPIVAGRLGLL